MTDNFDWFKDNGIYMPMINDTGRNIFYKAAIEAAVPGKVVCDIGTGSGLLSIIAAKAGASKVYAVEMDPGRAAFAEEMFAKLGLTNIEVVKGDFLNTDIRADIYVSETIGSQVFNENIIAIARHALRYGGEFIPAQFDLRLALYENHPIFPMVQFKSDAFEFQPDIDIDPTYEAIVNSTFQEKHPLLDTLYRANCIHDLFRELPKFTDLKLNKLYETEPVIVDLNNAREDNIRIRIPASAIPADKDVCAVLFWTARSGNYAMELTDTIWGYPDRIILRHLRKPGADIETWYDHSIQDWRFSF